MLSPEEQQFQMQGALQQQNLESQQSINAPYMLNQNQAVQSALVEQINPDRILNNIRLTLAGKEEDWETGEIKEIGEALMNDKGIGNIILLAKSVVNQNTIMSSLEPKEINKMVLQLADDIGDDLELNWKEYGINDKIKLDIIMDIVLNMSYPSLKRAQHGGERRFLRTTTVENISTTPRMPQLKKEGFLSRFKL